MFIENNSSVNAKIHYKKDGFKYRAFTSDEFKEVKLNETEKAKYSTLLVQMRELTWGLFNEMQEDAMLPDMNSERQFNYKVFKENKMKKLMIGWDAKDAEGKPIPINSASISRLSPLIAEAIIRAYDSASFIDKEEEGKL